MSKFFLYLLLSLSLYLSLPSLAFSCMEVWSFPASPPCEVKCEFILLLVCIGPRPNAVFFPFVLFFLEGFLFSVVLGPLQRHKHVYMYLHAILLKWAYCHLHEHLKWKGFTLIPGLTIENTWNPPKIPCVSPSYSSWSIHGCLISNIRQHPMIWGRRWSWHLKGSKISSLSS